MTRWTFRLRDQSGASIDASPLRRSRLTGRPVDEIGQLELFRDGAPVALRDVFDVQAEASQTDEVTVRGRLTHVHGLAAAHDHGTFRVEGDVGNFFAAGQVGGQVELDGDAADHVAAALPASRVGMSGGTLTVAGSVGNYLAHRMRRGTVLVGGSAGAFAAASMIAGTVVVGGGVGEELAVNMRRGTLLLPSPGIAPTGEPFRSGPTRFSRPFPFVPNFLGLYADPPLRATIQTLIQGPAWRLRADRNVGGQGEIIVPGGA